MTAPFEAQIDLLPLDERGQEFMENHVNHALKASLDFDSFPEPKIKSVEISFQRSPEAGLGFNIVGGTKTPHIPGHNGIFVSKIRPDSPASVDGRLNVGDRILSVNGIHLSDTTHDEAVEIFRNVENCNLVVEPDAERILLSEPSSLIMPSIDDGTSTAISRTGDSKCFTPARSPSKSPAISPARSPSRVSRDNIDAAKAPPAKKVEIVSQAAEVMKAPLVKVVETVEVRSLSSKNIETPKTHSPLEATKNVDTVTVPLSPKKDADSSSPSIYTEVFFVSIGIVAIGIGIFVGIRYFKRK